MVVNVTASQKRKNKGLLSTEKNINEKKYHIIIIRKCFNLKFFASL